MTVAFQTLLSIQQRKEDVNEKGISNFAVHSKKKNENESTSPLSEKWKRNDTVPTLIEMNGTSVATQRSTLICSFDLLHWTK